MKKMMMLLLAAGAALMGWSGTLDVTRVRWDASTSKVAFSIKAEASLKARTVYLVWDTADRGANWLDWERGEVLGTLPAGATTATFSASLAARYASAYRVFTFDATETGDAYLSYITSTGSQYLNTGIKPSYQSAAWIDYNWNDTTGQQRAFGTYGTFVFNHYLSGTAATGGCLAMACRDGDGQWYNNGTVVNKNRITVTIDSYVNSGAGIFRIERDGNLPCDKTVKDAHWDGGTDVRTKTADRPLYVCANNNDTKGTAGCKAKINLYRFKLWEKGEAKADYRPYVKDGVAGVLDSVSGNFIKSAVTTAFVAGTRLGAAPLDASGAVDAKVGAINDGTATFSYLTGGLVSELAGVDSLVLRNATFKYEGKDGERGYYEGDVALVAGVRKQAVTFDITGDLTLSGKFENTSGYSAFIKTGPGTLRLPGNTNETYLIRGSSLYESENALGVLKPKADGTTPDQGYQVLTVAEGRLVLGENGGKFLFKSNGGTDFQIGRLTVDPLTQAGQQEVEAVFEVAGGTTIISNWTNVGGKNGFVTTTPNKVPESGIRVTGGSLTFANSLTLGRNKSVSPQKDASGNWIRQRCCPFIEVLGGTLKLVNTSRIGFCDDPGADTRVLVDKGTLIVRNIKDDAGAGIVLGCCAEGGDTTVPRTCTITVRNGGRLDCTDFWINNGTSIHNITCNIEVVEGGIYRNNIMRKCSTSADCQLNMLFDGGIAEMRWAGYSNWIDKDVTKVAIGTRGALFRAGTGSGCDVWSQLHHVQVPLVAEDTHPGEAPQGLTIGCTGNDRNGGWIFHKPNTYLGPTKVTASGRLEFTEEGTFPATSDVIMGPGRLVLTNMAHTVKSLTFGVSLGFEKPYLALVAGQPITVKGPFAVTTRVTPLMQLYSAPYVPLTNATDVGSHDLIRVPVAYKTALDRLASTATWYNPGDGLAARFSTATEGDEAVLKVTIVSGGGDVTLHPPAGDLTEEADSLEGLRELDTGFIRLGLGTLVYTGTGEAISGLIGCAGDGETGAAMLDVANDLTLYDFATQGGRFYKRGKGDLMLMGNGLFVFGTSKRDYDTNKRQGISDEGEPPCNASWGLSVAEGRVIIGVKDDPENAPHVIAQSGMAIGVRTAGKDSGRMETAGEVIMNNGVLEAKPFTLSYYCGYPSTTPEGGLHPKFIINGGFVNLGSGDSSNIGQDWEGNQTSSPEFEMNGGALLSSNIVQVGCQAATGVVDNAISFTINAGTFTCTDFYLGNNALAPKITARFNGGDLICYRFRHLGDPNSTNKGYAEAHFNGTVIHPGWRRGANDGPEFPVDGINAKNRLNKAFVGEGGFIIDFDVWGQRGVDCAGTSLRQPLLHDPDCVGEDGGITLRNKGTMIFRDSASGCTFTGPVVAENGSVIGIDNGWNGFADANRRFVVRNGGGFRMSGQVGYLMNAQLGEEGDTALITLDLCEPSVTTTGLAVKKTISIKAPITVSFHRGGGACNTIGTWFGTTDILYYPADQDANVPLDKFVANPLLPGMKMTFAKGDVTSGSYAGYKKVSVTTVRDYASGTAWNATSAGGAWEESANWAGGAAVSATNALATFRAASGEAVGVTVGETTPTVGTIALHGGDATKGYALSGGAINLHQFSWNDAAGIVAVSGSHTIANALVTDNSGATASETLANGGRNGAIGLSALSNATLTVTGTVSPNASYAVVVNPTPKGGGKVLFRGSVESGTGMNVQSGTLDLDDFRRLNGRKLTIGPATVHYTGDNAMTESSIVTQPGAKNKTSVLRLDNRLVVNGTITAAANGNLIKTGPGELVVNGLVTNQLGAACDQSNWNLDTAWLANGDSLTQGNSPFSLDEGTVTIGRLGQHTMLGNLGDIFIGSQTRGWDYTTDKVTLNMMGGVMDVNVLAIGHGMRRGTRIVDSVQPHRENYICRQTFDGTREALRIIDYGSSTKYGIQDVVYTDGKLWCFFYPATSSDLGCAVLDKDMNLIEVLDFYAAQGVDALPPRFGTSANPRFLVSTSSTAKTTGGASVSKATLRFVEVVGGKVSEISGTSRITTVADEFAGVTGHVQGMACTDDAIYLSFITSLVKIDWTGHVVKKVEARRHLGDITFYNGRIYGALSETPDPNEGLGGTPYLVTYDTDLNLLSKTSSCIGDGIAVVDGKLVGGGGTPSFAALAYAEFNQYGGVVSNRLNTYIGYDLTKYDSHIRANVNLYGGTYLVQNFIRLGQTYNKTGSNEPLSTITVDGGTIFFPRGGNDRIGNIYVPYGEGIDQLKASLNRASDGKLVVKSGMVTNAYLIAVGQNGGRGEVHLDGGLLDCENLVHHTYDQTASVYYYGAFNVPDGTSCVYFNGGVFQPHGAMDSKLDTKARLEWNATLTNFTDLVVQADGARISTAAVKAERYTLAQTLTHDAALGDEPDGGLEKTGAGVLAMSAQMAYTGETRIEEGTLLVTKEAPEGELLPNSTLRVAPGATLEFEKGAKATISKIAIDCAETANATLKNPSLAKEGTLYLTNVSGIPAEGLAIPVSVVGKARMANWQVYVNGVKYEGGLKPVVREGKLVLGLPNGLAIIVR